MVYLTTPLSADTFIALWELNTKLSTHNRSHGWRDPGDPVGLTAWPGLHKHSGEVAACNLGKVRLVCDYNFAGRTQTHSSIYPLWRTSRRVSPACSLEKKEPEADRLVQALPSCTMKRKYLKKGVLQFLCLEWVIKSVVLPTLSRCQFNDIHFICQDRIAGRLYV